MQSGFSLVEMVIVAGISLVLVTMISAKFDVYNIVAMRVEAKQGLRHISTLQKAYFVEWEAFYNPPPHIPSGSGGWLINGTLANRCADALGNNPLGFELPSCLNARYGYWTIGVTQSSCPSIVTKLFGTLGLMKTPQLP